MRFGTIAVGRIALTLSVVVSACTGVSAAEMMGASGRAYASVTFVNDYPDMDATDCSVTYGADSWCKGSPSTDISPRKYGYRNCTDGVAYWIAKYTGVVLPDWGNANQWASKAPSGELISGTTTTNIEPGDIAQSNDGSFGHVGFVTSVTKKSDGTIASFATAEMNRAHDGNYNPYTYSARNSAGKFIRGTNQEWDNFIDVNGAGKGLNNEDLNPVSTLPPPPPNNTLYFIKTSNTAGTVEVHSAIAASNYQTADLHSTTYFSQADGPNGTFQMWRRDLYYIKEYNTGSGKIELHTATAASGYQVASMHTATVFNSGDAGNGLWQMADVNHDGIPDLVFIKERNTTSGAVEVFVSYGPAYAAIDVGTPTAFSPADAANGTFQIQNADLVYIKTKNTGTGTVEYFRAPIGYNFQRLSVATGTIFNPADAANGLFSTEDMNSNGQAALVFVKTQNAGSGHVELFVSNGTDYYHLSVATPTYFNLADGSNDTWEIADGS